MKPKKHTFAALFAFATAALLGRPVSHAATVVWQTPVNISAPSDVSTTGSLVHAYNFGGTGVGSVTLNGVTFDPFAVADFGSSGSATDASISMTGFGSLFRALNTAFGSLTNPFALLDSNLKLLLQSGLSATGANAVTTLTLSNLTIGQDYEFQLFSNDSSGASGNLFSVASGNSVSVDSNTTNAGGGIGQSVRGTFTADATTQVFSPSAAFALNAFQIRNVTSAPEPSRLLLLGLGAAFYLVRRTRVLSI